MKKKLLIGLSLTAISLATQAQNSFNAIKTSQRGGVIAATLNPAELAGMPQRFDFNLVGFDLSVSNNLVPLTSSKMGDFSDPKKLFFDKVSTEPFNARINLDVLGPSLAYAINKKTTFGISTRARAFISFNDMDLNLAKSILETDVTKLSLPYNLASSRNQSFNIMNWFEIGVSGATRIINTPQHTVKIGMTAKGIMPGANGGFYANNMNITIDTMNNSAVLKNSTANVGIGYSGASDVLNSVAGNLFGAPKGFAFDAGISYEFKNAKTGKYIVRAGASLVDVGTVEFTSDPNKNNQYALNTNGGNLQLNKISGKNFDEIIASLEATGMVTKVNSETTYTVQLPMAANLYADVNVWKPFYVTLHMQRQANSSDNPRALKAANYFTVTPRIVSRFIEIYAPFTFSEVAGNLIGAGMKVGPLYLGSSSLISAMTSDESKQVDVHFGIRMGFGNTLKAKK